MKQKEKRKIEIIAPLFALLFVIIVLHFTTVNIFDPVINETIMPIIEGSEDEFTVFALLANFAYELIPQILQQVGIGAISTVLLIRGFSPWAFGLVIAIGKLTGQYIIYFAFRFGFHAKKKNLGGLASANHWMHKYHFVAFLFPPWVSIGGDMIMALAGHQRINPLKILPILLFTDIIEAYKWVFWTLGQLELTDSMSN